MSGAEVAVMASFQAAGAIASIWQTNSQMKMIQMGRKIEDEQLQTNLQMLRTQAAEASLSEMRQLRQNIGSQIAIQAARGTASGAGSAMSLQQASKAQFGEDERTRRLNLLAKQSSLRASNAMSAISSLTGETKLGQEITKKLFNTVGGGFMGGGGGASESGFGSMGAYLPGGGWGGI